MAITIPSDNEVTARVLAFLRNRLTGKDTGTESYHGKLAQAEAKVAWMILQAIAYADNDAVPTSKTSEGRLEEFAEVFGVPTNTAGIYGRKSATAAKGLQGTITGTKGTTVLAGTQATASDGVTAFELISLVTIPGTSGSGSVTTTFDAVTTGTTGNLAAGDAITLQNPPAGIDASVTLTAGPSTDGIDRESPAALLGRVYARLQTPPRGGTSSDYRRWAEAVSGVYRAYAFPHRNGLGSVDALITANGSGKGRDPGATIKTNVDNAINGSPADGIVAQRQVAEQGYRTLRPYFVATGMLIRTRLTPSGQTGNSKYAFDWDDTATPYGVAAYAAGPPSVLTIDADAPVTLTAAVDAGTKPRLQVLVTSTGATATPYQVRVTAYGGAGNRQLTLENPLPTGWIAPTATDLVYAGGPMVDTIAAALLAYVDGLGPGRGTGSTGYADPLDFWEDTCAISRLTQIALDATDTDGTRFAKNIVSGGVTIAYNGGAAAATDIVATSTVANGPELLYCKLGGIAVTQ